MGRTLMAVGGQIHQHLFSPKCLNSAEAGDLKLTPKVAEGEGETERDISVFQSVLGLECVLEAKAAR